ncbi:hypothetical protein ABW636_17010 [Aquimarina sp. 2201CG1-2-11]|uniref:hypothetical protein n=1 Tax=Aquimarina discodermiae TaxID=3231043 RepID=UPI003461ED92
MQTRNLNKETVTVQQGGGCCGTTSQVEVSPKESSCCEQPVDGSSCCDKEESRDTNSVLTGCC